MAFRRGRWVAAGAIAVAAVVVAVAGSTSGSGTAGLSAAPLGVNVAPWDAVYAGPGGGTASRLLKAAGIREFRYGGGSWADIYDWRTDTDIGNCLPDRATASFTSECASTDPLGFARLAQRAAAIGADTLVTVNYGSGTPALAAAWAASLTPGERASIRWEIGNESYGCWEVNNELAGPPARYQGYRPGDASAAGQYQTCPVTTQGPATGTRTLATSYASNALRFMRAIRAADPGAVIGVPWAFGSAVPGSAVADSGEWNSIVLRADRAYVGFVDAHYYPFSFTGSTGGASPTDSQVLRALRAIPALYAGIRAALSADDPGAAVVVGETAVSTSPTTTVCTPVGAVFAAGDTLAWLAAGARGVDWWDLNNYGDTGTACTHRDFGLLTSAAKPVPETPYYGYLLASHLAQPGALLTTLATSDRADVLAYQAVLATGGRAVAFINLNTAAARTVRYAVPPGLGGALRTWTYRAGDQDPANSTITTSTAHAASAITLPAESITIIETR